MSKPKLALWMSAGREQPLRAQLAHPVGHWIAICGPCRSPCAEPPLRVIVARSAM